MTARKARRRPKAPRFVQIDGLSYPVIRGGLVEVEGHHLSKRQVEQLEESIADRRRIAEKPGSMIGAWKADDYARNVGLSDLLWKYKPTAKAEDRILQLGNSVMSIVLAMTSLKDYSFYNEGAIREHGCAALQKLIGEAETQLGRLRHFADSMATEGSTKLQDWVAREKEFERIGKEVRP